MRESIEEKSQSIVELHNEREDKQKRIEELQTEMFGEGSEETEKKARQFFSKVGQADEESSKTQEIDELRKELHEIEESIEMVREELQELLVNVQFPLNETIDVRDNEITFPYSEGISQQVIEAIEMVLNEDLAKDGVTIDTDEIRVESTDVDEAMDSVIDRTEDLRSKANMMVDVEQYVEEINNRDEKLAKALYVLYRSGESLSKKELEERIGVETGALRGQLYYVLENDPYLQKSDQEFTLSDTGERVMEAFVDRYDRPEGLPEEVET